MKIVIIQGPFLPIPPIMGGAVEKRWFALAEEFVKSGHEVNHISRLMPGMKRLEYINGIKVIRVEGFNMPKSIILLKLYDFIYSIRILKKIDVECDIIISNTFFTPFLLKTELLKKTIVDVARIPKGQLKYYEHISRFRANSTAVENSIINQIEKKNHEKVIKIPNPIPYKISENEAIGRKSNIILFCGRIHPEKGLKILIDAFKLLENKNDYTLQIIGSAEVKNGGGGEKYYKSLCELSKGYKIEWLGAINNVDELNLYYKRAKIFVYPSISDMGETFGLAPLEAMSWGAVPIVSNLDCFKDFIFNEINGLIFNHRVNNPHIELEIRIAELIKNDQKLQILSKEALKVRKTHGVINISKLFLQLFGLIIKENK